MLDFGLALATQSPTFTFPHADTLVSCAKTASYPTLAVVWPSR